MDKSIRPPSRAERSLPDEILYTKNALERDLERLQEAWDDCQADRRRNAIYGYLKAVLRPGELVVGRPPSARSGGLFVVAMTHGRLPPRRSSMSDQRASGRCALKNCGQSRCPHGRSLDEAGLRSVCLGAGTPVRAHVSVGARFAL
jgi:hypothetical protein